MKDIDSNMQKVGLILKDCGPSQAAFYGISKMNVECASSNLDCSIFELNHVPPIIRARFGIFPITLAYLYDGILISTDIETTKFSLESCRASKRIFYVWDLEWMRKLRSFDSNQIYSLPELTIVCRSKEHADCIERISRRKVHVMPVFSIKELVKL